MRRCRPRSSCGVVTLDTFSVYPKCLCRRGSVCTVEDHLRTGGANLTLADELFYSGPAHSGFCKPWFIWWFEAWIHNTLKTLLIYTNKKRAWWKTGEADWIALMTKQLVGYDFGRCARFSQSASFFLGQTKQDTLTDWVMWTQHPAVRCAPCCSK